MTYTEKDFARMEHDPLFQRQYFWHCAMHMKMKAVRLRNQRNKTWDDIKHARHLERTSKTILENIDLMLH